MAEAAIGEYNLGQTTTSVGNSNQNSDPPLRAPFSGGNTVVSTSLPKILPTPVEITDSPDTQVRRPRIDKSSLERVRPTRQDEVDLRTRVPVTLAVDPVDVLPLSPIELQNKYVSEDNYTTKFNVSGDDDFYELTEDVLKNRILQTSDIEVRGRYAENVEYFPKFSLDSIIPRTDLQIKFILKLVNGSKVKLYTSKLFYDYLQDAHTRNIPYAELTYFPNVITIDLIPILDKVKSFYNNENKDRVRVNSNVCVDITRDDDDVRTYEVDYDKAVRYLSWLMTKPSADYEKRILPTQEISNYETYDEYDAKTDVDTSSSDEQSNTSQSINQSSNNTQPNTSQPNSNPSSTQAGQLNGPPNRGGITSPPPPPPNGGLNGDNPRPPVLGGGF